MGFELLIAFGTSLALAGAWLVPGTLLCALLGFLAALGFVSIPFASRTPLRTLFAVGILVHHLAFYWLFGTIREFGGFPTIFALLIFELFVLSASLQFVLYGWAAKKLQGWLGAATAAVLAWTALEIIFPRIFPWYLGHTQLAALPLAHFASIGGSSLVSSVLCILAAIGLSFCSPAWRSAKNRLFLAVHSILILAGLTYLHVQASQDTPTAETPSMLVRIVQGNVSLQDKHSRAAYARNIDNYISASSLPADSSPDVLIWPETVIMELISEDITQVSEHPTLEAIHRQLRDYFQARGKVPHVLVGSLAHNNNREVMNSAFFIEASGRVHRPYHKIILMPFGEFTPFGDVFPFLRKLNANVADFARGKGPVIFPDPKSPALPGTLRMSPLVCYEDVVESLASEATAAGAEVLVNLTNDSWFGKSPAGKQHHLIASFRAIETGRPLVRATNSGFTAVVGSDGKTLSYLEPYERASLDQRVYLSRKTTLYQMGLGKGYSLAVLFLFISILSVRCITSLKASRP